MAASLFPANLELFCWFCYTSQMVVFEDVDDVRDWLAPMGYIAFWEAVAHYGLMLQDRDHCDELIASGKVDQALILDVLKSMARRELTARFSLKERVQLPPNHEVMLTEH